MSIPDRGTEELERMGAFTGSDAEQPGGVAVQATRGIVMDWGWRYDLMVAVLDVLLGRKLRALRQGACDLAGIQAGEAVLDVGCGTGTLALEVYGRVGGTGHLAGVDPGPQQIARARSKMKRAGFHIDFQIGVIEQLGFADGSFDVVLSTLIMHHLPDDVKCQGLSEIIRVLKPGGRLVIGDFMRPEKRPGEPVRLGAGQTGLQDLPDLMQQVGFVDLERHDTPFPRLPGVPGAGFVLGRKA
jgi:ubiquinone/menaquinone biosynthesis C-methylase UbiE